MAGNQVELASTCWLSRHSRHQSSSRSEHDRGSQAHVHKFVVRCHSSLKIWNVRYHSSLRIFTQTPHKTNANVPFPGHRAPMPSLRGIKQETMPLPQTPRTARKLLRSRSATVSPSRGRKNKLRTIFASNLGNLHLTYRTGEWKYEFKTSTLTTRILIFLFDEAEQKARTRDFYTYVGPGSDGSKTDKLSLNLKFNPQNTAIFLRATTDEKDSLHIIQHVRILAYRTEQRSTRRY